MDALNVTHVTIDSYSQGTTLYYRIYETEARHVADGCVD